jgi:hypothetical protein
MTELRAGVLFCLLVCSLTGFAQSQAPVDWSQSDVRWFGVGSRWPYYNQAIAMMGDSLFIADRRYESGHANPYLAIFYSYNNGLSFDSIRLDTGYWDSPDVCLSGTRGRIAAFCNCQDPRGWIRCSATEEMNWRTCQISSGPGFTAGYIDGNQNIAIQALVNSDTQLVIEAIGSEDGGITWSDPQQLHIGHLQVIDNGLCATRSSFLALGVEWSDADNAAIMYTSRRSRSSTQWHPFERLPGQPFFFYNCDYSIAADTGSETAIVLTSADIDLNGAPRQLRIQRTTDGGETWDVPRFLTQDAPISGEFGGYPIIFCKGKLWGVAWEKTTGNEAEWGLYWRMSANHGNNWYPTQRILSTFLRMISTTGQFVDDEARLYWRGAPPGLYDDYGTISGVITPDTTVPLVTLAPLVSDTVNVGDRILFSATASDDDTLSGVILTVVDSTDSPVSLRLARQGQGRYWGNFTVPHAGYYRYRITAEDFWENAESDPDTGWYHFQTQGWSSVEPRGAVQPLEYSVSVFPNPFNAVTTISFTLPQAGKVELNVFDVTGRRVRSVIGRTQGSPLPAGEHRMEFQVGDLPSGIYFVRLAAGEKSVIRKMVLVR